jgi:hypothetical protein
MDTAAECKIFASFHGNDHAVTLPDLCHNLLMTQKTSWDMLAKGYAALENIRVRELRCDGFSVRLHHNPARIKSTTAPIDQKSITARPCFLCLDNLPEHQQGILYRQNFMVLCNPFPITSHHFTIPHVTHAPQSFDRAVEAFLKMAQDFHPGFNVFYNGPESGASAPDHLHFQATPAGILPVEKDINDRAKRLFVTRIHGVSLFNVHASGRGIILIEGAHGDTVAHTLVNIISAMKNILSTPGEPKMNLLGSHDGTAWRVAVFPRQKHRPGVFYLPGDERILISPGLVEMGGIVVTPLEKDFHIVNHDLVQEIYKEVSVDAATIDKILAAASFC